MSTKKNILQYRIDSFWCPLANTRLCSAELCAEGVGQYALKLGVVWDHASKTHAQHVAIVAWAAHSRLRIGQVTPNTSPIIFGTGSLCHQ